MSLRLYMDVHVRDEITRGLRRRDVDVLTAQEDAASELSDVELLVRATERGCALFTQDEDLLIVAAARQQEGQSFGGVIYAHQLRISIGRCIDELELIVKVYVPDEIQNSVIHLPLR